MFQAAILSVERPRVFDTMRVVIAIQDLFASLIGRSRASLQAARTVSLVGGIGLIALIALPPLALAQVPARSPSDRSGNPEIAELSEAGMLGIDSDEIGAEETGADERVAQPERRPQLDWTQNPGAFEQELRRRISNPLFPPERQRVRQAELKAAKIRDAADARSVLAQFVNLSLDRRKLANLKTVEEIDLALARYQTVLRAVMGVGGEVASLVDALQISRSALIEQWRVGRADQPEILAALNSEMEQGEQRDPATHNEFAAQLQREDGPITADELVPALLSEPTATIELVLATLSPEQLDEIRIAGLNLILSLQSRGVAIDDEQAKVDLLQTAG